MDPGQVPGTTPEGAVTATGTTTTTTDATGQEPAGDTTSQGGESEAPQVFDRAYVEKLRRTEAGYRTRAQQEAEARLALEQELQAYRDAELSAQERLERDLDEARQRAEDAELAASEANLRTEVARHAGDVHDMEDVLNLLDLSQIGWDGTFPTGVQDAVEQLLASKPWLRKQQSTPPPNLGSTNPGGPRPGATGLTRADLKGMSSEEINRRWSEVSQILAQ